MDSIRDIEGIGEVTGMKILCGIELGRRLYDIGNAEKIFIKNSEDAYSVLKYIGKESRNML